MPQLSQFMSKCTPATKAELKWCERLRKVLKSHPKKLWLFAGDGELHVMKTPPDGNVKNSPAEGDADSINNANIIASYFKEINADGGGW